MSGLPLLLITSHHHYCHLLCKKSEEGSQKMHSFLFLCLLFSYDTKVLYSRKSRSSMKRFLFLRRRKFHHRWSVEQLCFTLFFSNTKWNTPSDIELAIYFFWFLLLSYCTSLVLAIVGGVDDDNDDCFTKLWHSFFLAADHHRCFYF